MKQVAYLAWVVAALLTVYLALAVKAPEIERDIDARATEAVAAVATHPIAVETVGRDVSVSGYADTDAEREKIIQAVRDVWGARGPQAEITVLPRLAAYPFTLRRQDGGAVAATGAAPSEAERAALERIVRAAFGAGTAVDIELASGAPADWSARLKPAIDILAQLDRGMIEVAGETIRLEGATRSEAVLESARAEAVAASAERNQPWSIDLSLIKPQVRPFALDAEKSPAGGLSVSGYAPNAEARTAISEAANDLALGAASAAEITLADGMPGPDWTGFAIRRMGALAALAHGRLEVRDFDLRLSGEAATLDAAIAAEDAFLGSEARKGEPAKGEATLDLALASYALQAETDSARRLTLRGAAPDADAAAAITERARDQFGQDAIIRLVVASGADASWTERVLGALDALAQLDRGNLAVEGERVSLSGFSSSEAAIRRLEREITDSVRSGAIWDSDVVFEPPTLSPFPLTVVKAKGGAISISGGAPDAEARQALIDAARRLGPEGREPDVALARGAPEGWVETALAAIPTLDLIASGSLDLRDRTVFLSGRTRTPEEADAALAAFSEALGDRGSAELTPDDPRRAPGLTLSLDQTEGAVVAGRLPEGIGETALKSLLDLERAKATFDISDDGRGDVERWREGLRELGEFLPEFERLSVSIGEGAATLEGETIAASNLDQVREFLKSGFAKAFKAEIAVAPSQTAYAEGTTRENVLTGRRETLRGGFWLPEFTADQPEDCDRASDVVLQNGSIRFLVGSAELDVRARRIVNELSSIAVACLAEGSALTLEIGGHTDSTGGDGFNMTLSEERAGRVRAALAERGVNPAAMQAIGYGESQPVGDNDTEAGRAANRRITFNWVARTAADPAAAPAEGAAPSNQ